MVVYGSRRPTSPERQSKGSRAPSPPRYRREFPTTIVSESDERVPGDLEAGDSKTAPQLSTSAGVAENASTAGGSVSVAPTKVDRYRIDIYCALVAAYPERGFKHVDIQQCRAQAEKGPAGMISDGTSDDSSAEMMIRTLRIYTSFTQIRGCVEK